jgi:hypothetical protein
MAPPWYRLQPLPPPTPAVSYQYSQNDPIINFFFPFFSLTVAGRGLPMLDEERGYWP